MARTTNLTLSELTEFNKIGYARIASEMLTRDNDTLTMLGPYPEAQPETYARRFRYWLGAKIVNFGCRIMGDDAPNLE